MFEKRRKGNSIGFGGLHQPGQKTRMTVEVGDTAELRLGKERALVKVTKVSGGSRFEGIIQGFQPSRTHEYQGYRENQKIDFGEENIFNCHRQP